MKLAADPKSAATPTRASQESREDYVGLHSRIKLCLRCWGSEGVVAHVIFGTVTLRGVVTSSAVKHQVAGCCRHSPGVFEIVDVTRVIRPR